MPWREFEQALSGQGPGAMRPAGDGGDAPAWSRRREAYVPPADLVDAQPIGEVVPYAELHMHSNYSFLDGASHPEELAEEAARLRLSGAAITDHDGMYGVVRFASAARELGLPTVFGVELSLGLSGPQSGMADPEGAHLLVLATGPEAYRRLCRVITAGHLGEDVEARRVGEKGRPVYRLEYVAAEARDEVLVLTGCRKGAVRQALTGDRLTAERITAAGVELDRLVELFGSDRVVVELIDHSYPLDSDINDALSYLAGERRLPVVATNAVHYSVPDRSLLASAVAAVRARRSLDEMDGWLPPWGAAFLRSGAEMATKFRRYPGAVATAARLGRECAFDLSLVAPALPPWPVPDGHTEASFLREITYAAAETRYGPRSGNPKAWAQLDHELDTIAELGFPGYFLVVWDLVSFARRRNILCQGRGSAANSAVCFALGVTAVDAVGYGLLFERFLSPERDGPPDIDVDFESDRREEVIQYVYEKYGRRNAAQVANVITYRPRSAIRDMAKALGYSTGQQDAFSKQIDGWAPLPTRTAPTTPPAEESAAEPAIPDLVLTMAAELEGFPRHLGIHSGGMVITDRPVSEVCPVEWARMADRSVLQWDKDDCAAAGLVKFDLLGLGMLSALHYGIDLIAEHHGQTIDIAKLNLADEAVYDMLCRADTVGVFQVESRAQMATLPRLRPRTFHDLAMEIALIRPGPIQGGSVHPYIRRRHGLELADSGHPLLDRALAKTLGVPLFQEQLMQMAMDVADFTAAEADDLRRAMGSKRSAAKMERLRQRLYDGMAGNGITGDLADTIYRRITAFAAYGFPESHAISFAVIAYASSWMKLYYPAAFLAALLRAQPMGFYSPQSLVADARRHGVNTHAADINASLPYATLEPDPGSTGGHAVRLGLAPIRGIGDDLAQQIVDERDQHGPYAALTDLTRRIQLTVPHTESLATAGAFAGLGTDRRQALWTAGAAARDRPDGLPDTIVTGPPPTLPGMTDVEVAAADLWSTGVTPGRHPIEFVRDYLDQLGAVPAARLADIDNGTRVLVGGLVTHRQRPATATGITFMNLEDETGMINVVVTTGLWTRVRTVARHSNALIVRGLLERGDGVITLNADHLRPLQLGQQSRSRDFR